jgi:IMP dehydrogenase
VRFLNEPSYDLTYDDVFMVPSHSELTSRVDVDLNAHDKTGTTIPLVVANMTAISGRRMAETIARRGGLAVIPQDVPLPVITEIIDWVKSRNTFYDTPLTLNPDQTVADVMGIIHKRAHGAVVVVEDGKPIGIVTEEDCSEVDRFTQVKQVMSKELITITEDLSPREAFDYLNDNRTKLAPVVAKDGKLLGILTKVGALRASHYNPALDKNGKLIIAVAVGINGDVAARAEKILKAGADVLVVDTAHGHQKKMIEALTAIKALNPQVPIVAGNVVTAAGVKALIDAGADIVKVGVGPGAMCTTRMQTGVGRPQFSAVLECSLEAKKYGKTVWADGGVRHPRDVALALAAGCIPCNDWFLVCRNL